MAAHVNAAPVIIKRKKVIGGDGHHGGAWKVAYADFVTAMMAFFLLMWLLNATTEKQRKGLADYFSPDIPISRVSGGGDGAFSGSSPFSEDVQARDGIGATDQQPTSAALAKGQFGALPSSSEDALDAQFQEIESALKGLGGESAVSSEMAKHIITKVTDEGLIIELFSTPEARMFAPQTAIPTRLFEDLIGIVARASMHVVSEIAVEGHVRSRPVVLAQNPVWPLSFERAITARNLLQKDGVPARRIQRLTGYADRDPVAKDPMHIRNNRVSIILLRKKE